MSATNPPEEVKHFPLSYVRFELVLDFIYANFNLLSLNFSLYFYY
jgi:hypothetical protein